VAVRPDALSQALRLHQAGRLAEAEPIYREILRDDPDHVDALQLLGLILHHTGRTELAFDHLRAALRLKPDYAEVHNNLGNMLRERGALEEAVASFRQALRWKPNYPEARATLSHTLHALGQRAAESGRLDEAVTHNREAVHLNPGLVAAYSDLANVLVSLGLFEESLAPAREAILLSPDLVIAHMNLATALARVGDMEGAIAANRRLVELEPDLAEAHCNIGLLLANLERVDEAVAPSLEALRRRPDFPEAHCTLGRVHFQRGELSQAVERFRRSIELRPDFMEPHCNLALAYLKQGDFVRGWPEWEWRWRRPNYPPRPFPQPRWDGGDLTGRTLLVHCEQGLGDTLQFIRLLPLVKQRGGRLVFECHPPLRSLLDGFPDVDQMITAGEPLPDFDVEAPLLSLPGILGITLDNIPAKVPYIHVSDELVTRWRSEVAGPGVRVGIAWQGSPQHKNDRRRSVALDRFAPLAEVPGVTLISLQKGFGSEQIARAQFPVVDLGNRLETFADTAAVLQSLDLLISVDTAVIHCAGAFGVPAWLLLCFESEWRWLVDRDDSPWYPSMRLFRQPNSGEWDAVFDRVAVELGALTKRTGEKRLAGQ
jgi:tetratricopeptide (TPR) repeat protein